MAVQTSTMAVDASEEYRSEPGLVPMIRVIGTWVLPLEQDNTMMDLIGRRITYGHGPVSDGSVVRLFQTAAIPLTFESVGLACAFTYRIWHDAEGQKGQTRRARRAQDWTWSLFHVAHDLAYGLPLRPAVKSSLRARLARLLRRLAYRLDR